ncbi:HesA/MoeB/ThiF family protein [Vibrio sp. Of7-15]|uniref:HesA/MoeB/ThiF family protein n=1 Tax=Vibrio sp. Of7-15 TaxID=2724879 RepID=UPI001EF1EFAA|nr:HesA/MoeB/ThiF family protein [Vibrio sp. Of7-15]MCG7496700.1 HesA/MoeB/ThiF family protein [Vibrio sp. Of7-15]
MSSTLTDKEFVRYSRQIMLPQVSEPGQHQLKKASVLIVGAGGLGSAAGLYLAGAGVGTLVIADDDVVDSSNLQRQVVYRQSDEKVNKAKAAAEQLSALNPLIRVRPLQARLAEQQLKMEVMMSDVVLDCSDNMATRQAVNAACVHAQKPLISGAAIGWQGQLMPFDFRQPDSPCYHCVFPNTSDSEAQNCSTSGVMGPVVGTVGNLQALEAIKLLAGVKEQTFGYLHHFDGLTNQWQKLSIKQDPNCSVCGS